MNHRGKRILVYSPDPELVADVVEALDESFETPAQVVRSIGAVRESGNIERFDVIIADVSAEDADVLQFLQDATLAGVPAILVDDRLVAERVLGALRLGALDVLTRPVDFTRLDGLVRTAIDTRERSRRESVRSTRLRQVSSRMMRDRRELRQRIDLLCKDLVGAYRRLAEKVATYGDETQQ